MPLLIELQAHERIAIGRTLLRNGPQRTSFMIADTTAVLRDQEILTLDLATTPCKTLYLLLQCAYFATEVRFEHDSESISLAKEITNAAPSLALCVADVMSDALLGNYYAAMKNCKKLIDCEAKILGKLAMPSAPSHTTFH